jgi:AcrR family transcriptional regulator
MDKSATKKSAYHHGALRPALLAEALRLLEEGGVANLTLRGVVAGLGVSRTAPYNHFPNKQSLLAALAAEGFRELERATRAQVFEGPLERRIRGLMFGYVRFAQRQPALFRLMFDPYGGLAAEAEMMLAASLSFDALSDRLSECAAEFGFERMDIRRVALSLWALHHGFASMVIGDRLPEDLAGEEEIKRELTLAARIFADGLLSGLKHPS